MSVRRKRYVGTTVKKSERIRRDVRFGKQCYESEYMTIKYFYENNSWSINWMCKQLSVSRAAYYKWLHREVPIQEQENIELANLIKEYDERFNHNIGLS